MTYVSKISQFRYVKRFYARFKRHPWLVCHSSNDTSHVIYFQKRPIEDYVSKITQTTHFFNCVTQNDCKLGSKGTHGELAIFFTGLKTAFYKIVVTALNLFAVGYIMYSLCIIFLHYGNTKFVSSGCYFLNIWCPLRLLSVGAIFYINGNTEVDVCSH